MNRHGSRQSCSDLRLLREAAQSEAVVLPQRQIFLQEALLDDGERESQVRGRQGRNRRQGRAGRVLTRLVTRNSMVADAECLFCRIAARQVPATIIDEEPGLLAFADLHPQAPTHLLVIPTEHIPAMSDMTEAHTSLLGRALQFTSRLASRRHLMPAGYRIVINCGPHAGQSVGHLHLHLLGGRAFGWPPG